MHKERYNREETELGKFHKAVGEQLCLARKAAGLTQSQLAKKMRVTQPLIARLEQGKNNTSCETLFRFARACRCNLSFLMTKKGERKLPEPVDGCENGETQQSGGM